MNYENEIWKPIVGCEGLYEVSSYGRVRSLKRKAPRILKLKKDPDGYSEVGLYIDGKQKQFLVHRLVAEAFIPNPENKATVDHIDRVRDNNFVENLRWATRVEQNKNREKKGAYSSAIRNNTCRPIKCIETDKIFTNSIEAAEWVLEQKLTSSERKGYVAERIRFNAQNYRKSAFGLHWEFTTQVKVMNKEYFIERLKEASIEGWEKALATYEDDVAEGLIQEAEME